MNLDRLRNGRGELWLNVASSYLTLEDFVNFDNHVLILAVKYPFLAPLVPRRNRAQLETLRQAAARAPLVRHDCRRPLPVPEGAADHVLCSHFLEHVYPGEAAAILRDFRRVLRPGGTLHVIVPDIAGQAERYLADRAAGDAAAADRFVEATLLSRRFRGSLAYRLLELTGGAGLQHRWMYDLPSIRARVVAAGFELLEQNATPNAAFRQGDGSAHVVARRPAGAAAG